MRRNMILGVVMVLALALTACAPSAPVSPTSTAGTVATNPPALSSPTISVPVTGSTDTAVPPAGNDISGTATIEAGLGTSTPDSTIPGAGSATGTDVTISTSTGANVSEPFLVDQQGRALYLFTTDIQNSGTSACTDACLTQWQPVTVTGTPQAGPGVDVTKLGTITRQDGTLQAAYNGWPLYTFAGDTAPGSTSGQGMGGAWYLVSGVGNSIQQ